MCLLFCPIAGLFLYGFIDVVVSTHLLSPSFSLSPYPPPLAGVCCSLLFDVNFVVFFYLPCFNFHVGQ